MNSIQYILSPREAHEAAQKWRVVKRSVDARQRELRVHLTVLTDDEGRPVAKDAPIPLYEPPVFQDVHEAERSVVIIGCGPAGLFAALTLLEHGIKPIIYERGKEVSERKKDIALLNRNEGLNPESNYCFGEGGAGTFSDGKLFSRSKKRGNMQRVMEIFHYFGAPDTVLYEAHAHIGSDKLPGIIKRMRECILEHGGEIHFETCVTSLKEVTGYGLSVTGTPIILAIGHSAHDTYRMLAEEGVQLETKGFAMGVRIEHPQSLINRLMYHLQPSAVSIQHSVIDYVGNASYSLVTQVEGRGVYSFCMCPGGHIVPAGSSEGTCVVNGMSASHRNSPYANSGMVVQINPEDIRGENPLRGLEFQESIERLAWEQALKGIQNTDRFLTHKGYDYFTDRIQTELIDYVGNASYSMVTQVDGRGVYSFCMCPGGHIVPAGSSEGTCVVNGMSASHRNSPYANSGMVVQINPEDIEGDEPLRGLEYQEALEKLAYEQAHQFQISNFKFQISSIAPAQRMRDFVEGKASKDLPACSYLPGIVPSRLDQWLPAHIGKRLQQGFRDFDKKYPGFLTNEAVIVGVESRSSSAVRIVRDPETLESVSTPGLYPCGEGAGYAGGITSSALDGINAALKIAELA